MSESVTIDLTAERLNRGWSLRQAAQEIGISPNVLSRAEDGTMPRPTSAKRIADVYGYMVTDIWPLEAAA